jgi:hypothetical protein
MSLTHIKKTGQSEVILASDDRLSISVPIQIKRRGGRKVLAVPGGESATRQWDNDPTPLQRALPRRHLWLAFGAGYNEVAKGNCQEGGRGQ